MLGFLAISVRCNVRGVGQGTVSFCTPTTDQNGVPHQKTVDVFKMFKKIVNRAANNMAVPHSIDESNPNLDEDMFRLMILIAQSFAAHMDQQGKAAEVSQLMRMMARAQTGQTPDQFQILSDNIEPLMAVYQGIGNGDYGQRVTMTPTVAKPPYLRPGALVAIAGVGLFTAALLYAVTRAATKGAT